MHFFMFHFGRSGSTVLCESLNQLPGLTWHGEIFSGGTYMYEGFDQSEWAAKKGNGLFSLEEFLGYIENAKSGLFQVRGLAGESYGCEIKAYHFEGQLFDFTLEQALEALNERFDNARFLFLGRENALRRLVSMQVAKRRNVWHRESGEATVNRITVDVDDCRDTSLTFGGDIVSVLKNAEFQRKRYADAIRRAGGVEFTYETDINQGVHLGVRKFCAAFGFDQVETKVRFKRTNAFGLDELVTNYGELEERLAASEFSSMLD